MEATVKVIKAKPIIINKVSDDVKHLRVAAYARVSTDSLEQEDSFERQVEYYTNYIKLNPSWDFVKVFCDPGITGTRADKRPGFMEMIEECRKGNIDKVLVKSLARFARNTVDALNYIRELKELGVSVYFESQNIDTSTPGGDVLLTILAAMAEEESRTISKNVKWAMEKKFQKGDFMLNTTRFMGYKKDENGKCYIVEEEAKIIRRIFSEFLSGYSIGQIQKHLNDDKVETPCKGKGWYYSVISSILQNEKYYGAALMGKTYKPDVLSKRRYKNKGQAEMYFAEGVIETPIISKEIYDMAQAELKRRNELRGRNNIGKYTSNQTFSKMIKCGSCGAMYKRVHERCKGVDTPYWWCNNRRNNKNFCPQKGIKEEWIKRAFVEALNELVGSVDDAKRIINISIRQVLTENPLEEVKILEDKILRHQDQMAILLKKYQNGELSQNEYQNEGSKISKKIDEIRTKKEKIETNISSSNMLKERINEINYALDSITPESEFDEFLFKKLVEAIVVSERYKVKFIFKVGIERTIDTSKYK